MYSIVADEGEFIVICKSANVHFHSQDGSPGVVASLAGDMGEQFYPVHRLDSITSGLLILARSPEVAKVFGYMFSGHMVQKYYIALANGKPKKKQGKVVGDIAKSRRGKYKLMHSTENPAITQFFSYSVLPGVRLFILKPLSGKTHQLRVVMNSLGTPIVGDTLYGGKSAERAYLHAWYLDFSFNDKKYIFHTDPVEGELFNRSEVLQVLQNINPPSTLPWPR